MLCCMHIDPMWIYMILCHIDILLSHHRCHRSHRCHRAHSLYSLCHVLLSVIWGTFVSGSTGLCGDVVHKSRPSYAASSYIFNTLPKFQWNRSIVLCLIQASFESHTVKLRSMKFCQALARLSCTGTMIYALTWLTGSKMSSTFP